MDWGKLRKMVGWDREISWFRANHMARVGCKGVQRDKISFTER